MGKLVSSVAEYRAKEIVDAQERAVEPDYSGTDWRLIKAKIEVFAVHQGNPLSITLLVDVLCYSQIILRFRVQSSRTIDDEGRRGKARGRRKEVTDHALL